MVSEGESEVEPAQDDPSQPITVVRWRKGEIGRTSQDGPRGRRVEDIKQSQRHELGNVTDGSFLLNSTQLDAT